MTTTFYNAVKASEAAIALTKKTGTRHGVRKKVWANGLVSYTVVADDGLARDLVFPSTEPLVTVG